MPIRVVVVGQGYVGRPMALALAGAGFEVFGLDRNQALVDRLNDGPNPSGLTVTTDPECLVSAGAVLLCVPTPRTEEHDDVIGAALTVAERVPNDCLVILESTVRPGFTRDVLAPLLDGCLVAFSPERIDPGREGSEVVPRLVGGTTPAALSRAIDLYEACGIAVHPVEVEVAELAKLLENSFRLVNIALVDELAGFCRAFGVRVDDVIRAAATKPYGYMPFFPGPGAGGHCIPVDPAFLIATANAVDAPMRLLDLALARNDARPTEVAQLARSRAVGGRALVYGAAYKPNVSDTRDTPTAAVIRWLEVAGMLVDYHDPLVPEFMGRRSVGPDPSGYGVAILLTAHRDMRLEQLDAWSGPIVDARGVLSVRPNVVRA